MTTSTQTTSTITVNEQQVIESNVAQVIKRDGRRVKFDTDRIRQAIIKAGTATGEFDENEAYRLTKEVIARLENAFNTTMSPTVEQIQDVVEKVLMLSNWFQTAKSYIIYRDEHAKVRGKKHEVSEETRQAVSESKPYFRNQLAEFVFYVIYSRWLPEKGRRETWHEAVDRYNAFMRENLGDKLPEKDYEEIKEAMLRMDIMGSNRLLWGAGTAARSNNCVAYNCSYVGITKWKDFGEVMFLSMSGCGVGFSVERQFIEHLPIIKRQNGIKIPTHSVGDSKEGWAEALTTGLTAWSEGKDIEFDFSQVRPEGARLKTMGGRASGPAPLKALLQFAREKMMQSQGRRLNPIEVHDIICKIGDIVVMGGVRRSAMISLSDQDDAQMRTAKNGQFYLTHPERNMANNSAAYNEKPPVDVFMSEWMNLMTSGSGERGVFNRSGLKNQVPARRWPIFERDAHGAGLNPCGEIILKSKQFCNLSQVIARPEDDEASLLKKVRLATILGTYQATLTNFPYLSPEWKKNCEEEALLGVSIDGIFDSPAVRNPITLRKMRQMAIDTNAEYAKKFGINQSTAVTCVKPSGNGSQLYDCASGCHPRYADYYIRRVRIERHNPIFHMIKDSGVPHEPEVGQTRESATTFVVEFPMKAPQKAITRHHITAIEHLEIWKMFKESFTEHNPSVTIYVGEDEWLEVGNWVYKNWEVVGGLAFLPRSNHVYQLAPYEQIEEKTYETLLKKFPSIDFAEVSAYEYDDTTTSAKELACTAGNCEV